MCEGNRSLCVCDYFKPLQQRYSTYDTGIGAKIEKGESSFEELEVSLSLSMFSF